MGNRPKPARPKATQTKRLADRLLKIQGTLSGRYNGWLCNECNGGFISLDVDRGTTPMHIPCFATEGCRGVAVSMGYPDGPPPAEPILYWYKPSKEEFNRLSVEMQDHVRNGGLVRMATEAAPEWVKKVA